jgi:hypothetical protein
MPFFKSSSKNQTASVATTPSQTPRTSLDQSRTATQAPKMAREETLELVKAKSAVNFCTHMNMRM